MLACERAPVPSMSTVTSDRPGKRLKPTLDASVRVAKAYRDPASPIAGRPVASPIPRSAGKSSPIDAKKPRTLAPRKDPSVTGAPTVHGRHSMPQDDAPNSHSRSVNPAVTSEDRRDRSENSRLARPDSSSRRSDTSHSTAHPPQEARHHSHHQESTRREQHSWHERHDRQLPPPVLHPAVHVRPPSNKISHGRHEHCKMDYRTTAACPYSESIRQSGEHSTDRTPRHSYHSNNTQNSKYRQQEIVQALQDYQSFLANQQYSVNSDSSDD